MALTGKKILVTGATGFTGKAFLRKVRDSFPDCEVRGLCRESSFTDDLDCLNISWFRGDIGDPELIVRAAKEVDYIFHIAAAYREAKLKDEDYYRVHVTSTKLLAQEAKKNPSFKRFIQVSTIGVHGHIKSPPADETHPFSPGDIYQCTKAEAEVWLREYCEKEGLSFTIIRPAAIYGPGDKRLLKLFKLASLKVSPLLGWGNQGLYHLIHVDDLCGAILAGAIKEEAHGEAFIIGNPAPVSLQEMIHIIGRHLGVRTRIIKLPALPFFILGFICEKVFPLMNMEPPIYRRRVAFFTKDRSFSTIKCQNQLYKTKITDSEGLCQTCDWYIEKGWLRRP